MTSSTFIEISNECIACGRCVTICPRYIFEIDEEKNKAVTNSQLFRCHNCGHCVAICPKGAITNHRMSTDIENDFPPFGDLLDYNQVLRLIRQRRSIRSFKDNPVSEENLMKLIDLGKFAPTGHNDQKVAYTIVSNRKDVSLIYEGVIDFFRKSIKNLHNPFWIALAYLIGKGEKVKKGRNNLYRLRSHIYHWEKGIDRIFHNAQALILIHVDKETATPVEDCAIAAQNIMLGAPSLGLGATYVGYLTNSWKYSKKVKKLLNLPKHHTFYACLAVGEPQYKFKRLVLRPEPDITHWNHQ